METNTKSASTYAAPDRRLFERLHQIGKAPHVVYDIGASFACWSVTVSDGFAPAEFHLFEPLAACENYKMPLTERLGERPTWTLHPIALSDSNGTATMYIPPKNPSLNYPHLASSTILDMNSQISSFPEQIKVPCWRLDDYCAQHGIAPPTFIKIDAQAAESLILEGAQKALAATEILLIETWLYRCYGPKTPLLSEIIEILHPMGFVICELGDVFRSKGAIVHVDAIFAKPEIASLLYS